MQFTVATLISLALAIGGYARGWNRTHEIVGSGFYDHFRFENTPDPTHGRVNYVDKDTAIANNLTYGAGNTFILRADYSHKVAAGERGRKSVRLISVQSFRHHVAIFDVWHMPQGCGTWPAIWENGVNNWPYGGEVDILEGVNDAGPNSMRVHTSPGCTIPADRNQTGRDRGTQCDAFANPGGCGASDPRENSYGPPFNENRGGWFALERTESFIKIWFWPRCGSDPPVEVQDGYDWINTDNWGTPTALFPSNPQCDIERMFAESNIIINLTLCGGWAGPSFNGNGCPGSCLDLVDNNPGAFAKAYFDLGSVRIYQ